MTSRGSVYSYIDPQWIDGNGVRVVRVVGELRETFLLGWSLVPTVEREDERSGLVTGVVLREMEQI